MSGGRADILSLVDSGSRCEVVDEGGWLTGERLKFEQARTHQLDEQRGCGLGPSGNWKTSSYLTGPLSRASPTAASPRSPRLAFAFCSIGQSAWARACYDALRALAFKWIRILFRCWLNRTPYDEKAHSASLTKHHSPLERALGPGVSVTWEGSGGLKKIALKEN